VTAARGMIDFAALIAEAQAPLREEIRALHAKLDALREDRADELLTVEEAARLMGVLPGALRKKIQRRTLAVVRVGRSVRIRRGALRGDGR